MTDTQTSTTPPAWPLSGRVKRACTVLAASLLLSPALAAGLAAPAGAATTATVAMAATPDGGGYWLAAADGSVSAYGDAHFYGSAGSLHLNKPIVGMAATPDGGGYWLAAADGGIFTYGDAHFYGSAGSLHLNKPIVGMAATPDGGGYWLAAADGGIFTYGDAHFYGSAGSLHLNKPIVGMAATPDGGGYWLAAADGGIFTYGDAHFYGSAGSLHLNKPIVGMAATPDGGGYWLAAADGGIFTYGDAHFYGSAVSSGQAAAAMAAAPGGTGYWVATSAGGAQPFGSGAVSPAPSAAVPPAAPAGAVAGSNASSVLACTGGDLAGQFLAVPPVPAPADPSQYNYEFTSLGQDTNQGVPGRWNPCETVHYVISTAGVNPSDVAARVADVQEAIAQAATATGLHFADDGTTTTPPRQWGIGTGTYRGIIFSWATDLGSSGIGAELGNTRVEAINPGGGLSEQLMSASVQLGTESGGQAVNLPQNGAFSSGAGDGEGPTLLHELGHALGLQHPSTNADQAGAPQQYEPAAPEVMTEFVQGYTTYQPGDLWALWHVGAGAGAGSFLE